MDKDKMIEWIENNEQELLDGFLKDKSLKDEFDEYCMQQYDENEQCQADAMYDAMKDAEAEKYVDREGFDSPFEVEK